MKLIRFFHVCFDQNPEKLSNIYANIGDVVIKSSRISKDDRSIILKSSTTFDPGDIDINRVADVRKYLRNLEEAAEIIANSIAVSLSASRCITSPTPALALELEDNDKMETYPGISMWKCEDKITAYPHADLSFDLINTINKWIDRLDGLSLMADIKSHNSSIGKMHDIIRVFERAFGVSDKKLIKPLYGFLQTGFGIYVHKEVHESWTGTQCRTHQAPRLPSCRRSP